MNLNFRFLLTLLTTVFVSWNLQAQLDANCIGFEDLRTGYYQDSTGTSLYKPGDILLKKNGVVLSIAKTLNDDDLDFYNLWVANDNMLGAPTVRFLGANGNYVFVNGAVRVDFSASGQPVRRVEFNYLNTAWITLRINDGAIKQFDARSILQIGQDIFPGVTVIVKPNPDRPWEGIIVLEGKISSFEFGGGESAIDNLCWEFATVAAPCSISNLFVNPLPCDSAGLYYVLLSFDHQGTSGAGFTLAGNGRLFGKFPYSNLPVKVGPFSSWLPAVNELIVTDNEFPDCRNFITFNFGCSDCRIGDVRPQVFPCDADGNFYVNLDLINHQNASDSFLVHFDDSLWGRYAYADLPVSIGPLMGKDWVDSSGLFLRGLLNVRDQFQPGCERTLRLQAPIWCDSTFSCPQLDSLEVLSVVCDSTNTHFSITFDAAVTGLDSFAVFVGMAQVGFVKTSDLPATIQNIPLMRGRIQPLTLVPAPLSPSLPLPCQLTRYFKVPCQPCAITNLKAEALAAAPGANTYSLVVDFDYQNSPNLFFDLYLNGDLFGTYPLDSLPLKFQLGCDRYRDVVGLKVCVNDAAGCCAVTQFKVPCQDSCRIADIRAEAFNCQGNLFDLKISFASANTSSPTFDLWVGGRFVGAFPYANAPLVVRGLTIDPQNPSRTIDIKICDSRNPDCCGGITIPNPCPTINTCRLDALTVLASPCDSVNNQFYLTVNFAHTNHVSNGFRVFVNGTVAGTFIYTSATPPVKVGPFHAVGPTTFVVTVQDVTFPDCRISQNIVVPGCGDDCRLNDLSIQPGPCTPNGIFYASLKFGYTGTGDSFVVRGSGRVYGTFSYRDLPIKLGPLMGDGRTVYEFVVIDKNHPDCNIAGHIVAPDCGTVDCRFSNISMVPGPCDNTGNFFVEVKFSYQGTSDSFQIQSGFGTAFAKKFAYRDLPVKMGPFAGNGQPLILNIADLRNQDCRVSFTLLAPNCNTVACDFTNVTFIPTPCDSGNFFVKLNFNFQGASDSFQVKSSTGWIGVFAYRNMPVQVGPFAGNGQVIELVLSDRRNADCREVIRLTAPNCNSTQCDIINLEFDDTDCDSSGQFYVKIDFDVVGGTDSFLVKSSTGWARMFGYGTRPILAGPFKGNGQAIELLISDKQKPDCREVIRLIAPACNMSGCGIFDLVAAPSPCDARGNFFVKVSFQFRNVSDSFYVSRPGFERRFAYRDLPILVGPFLGDGATFDLIVGDLRNRDCGNKATLTAPDCRPQQCSIRDLSAVAGDCDSSGRFYVSLKFIHQNTSDSFYVISPISFLNPRYAYHDLPIKLGPLPGNGQVLTFLIVDAQNRDCNAQVTFQAPNCAPRCVISDLVADLGDCDSTGHVSVHLKFNYQHTSDSFTVRVNGFPFGKYAYSDLPVRIGSLAGDDSTIYEIVVADAQNPDCRNITKVGPVYCGDDCRISNVHLKALDCDRSGFFKVALTFDHQNTGAAGFLVFANGRPVGPFPYGTPQPIILGPFKGDGRSVYDFLMLDLANPLCYGYGEVGPIDCEPCSIFDIVTRPTDCTNTGDFFVWLDFQSRNTGAQGFTVKGNGRNYGTYGYDALPVKLGPFKGDGNSVYELEIVDLGNSSCRNHTTFRALDCDGNNCRISDVVAAATPCSTNGQFFVDLKFQYRDPGNLGFTVRGNGRVYGRFLYTQLPVRLGPFAGDGRTVYEFEVIDNEHPDCINRTAIGPISCQPGNCNITDLVVKPTDCNPDGTYKLWLNFKAINTTNAQFDVFAPGRGLLGTFNISQLPVLINRFPASGNAYDALRVCINYDVQCCASVTFQAPRCAGDCVDFESLPDGKVFRSSSLRGGDTIFVENGVIAQMYPFFGSLTGPAMDSITADSTNALFDTGRGIALSTKKAAVMFTFPRLLATPCMELSFDYFQTGDENNIAVNGQPVRIFERFTDLPRSIAPGIRVEVTSVTPREGKLVLRGNIQTLLIGGQSLSIDNLCLRPCPSPIIVWPGDANADNVVNHLDLLNIGVAYGTQDLARIEPGNGWGAKPAEGWMNNFSTGVNYTNADCDGSGTIDRLDTEAILKNYGKIKGEIISFPEGRIVPGEAPLYVKFPDPSEIQAGVPFRAQIHLGTEALKAINAYGLAFTLRYDPAKLRILNFIFPPGWFGEPNEDVLTIDRIFDSYGMAHVAMSRNNQENVTGYGVVVDFIGIIDIIVGRSTTVEVDITDVVALSKDEFFEPVLTPPNVLDLKATGVIDLDEGMIKFYPNPTSGELTISNGTGRDIEQIQIFRPDGAVLGTIIPGTNTLSLQQYPAGLYLLKVQVAGKTYFEKVLKE